ncbi:hypothetical protein DL96DRAFT_1680342 [Flagelloscypha sp. PMI_526]|nr:hypothetical protein DL96DRAFT_1680342 [Flagelloscypha sp. PMI_526]
MQGEKHSSCRNHHEAALDIRFHYRSLNQAKRTTAASLHSSSLLSTVSQLQCHFFTHSPTVTAPACPPFYILDLLLLVAYGSQKKNTDPPSSPPTPGITDERGDVKYTHFSGTQQGFVVQICFFQVSTHAETTSLSHVQSSPNLKPETNLRGRIVCNSCNSVISIQDSSTGKFTGDHWEFHRHECPGRPQPQSPQAEESQVHTSTTYPTFTITQAEPLVRRRRAKRTEQERINYLKSDPYVSRFEHSMGCPSEELSSASRGRWIKLTLKDRDVRKFDSERIPLSQVQTWLDHRAHCSIPSLGSLSQTVPAAGHAQPYPKNTARFNSPPSSSQEEQATSSASGRQDQHPYLASPHTHKPIDPASPSLQIPNLSRDPHSTSGRSATPVNSPPSASSMSLHSPPPYPSSLNGSPSLAARNALTTSYLLSEYNSTPLPMHDSRRRNAEQRAAALRADRLISQVEPNRVFCSLCQKWVQLRQDSTYCAYPWLQHRGKCLARHQRRAEKAAQVAHAKAQKEHLQANRSSPGHPPPQPHPSLPHMHYYAPHTGMKRPHESDEVWDDAKRPRIFDPAADEEERARVRSLEETRLTIERLQHHQMQQERELATARLRRAETVSPLLARREAPDHKEADPIYAAMCTVYHHPITHGYSTPTLRPVRNDEHEADDAGSPRSATMGEKESLTSRAGPSGVYRSPPARHVQTGLADLDSDNGRQAFIWSSIRHLYVTTYEDTDELSISALHNYLAAAVPQDKFEDFDVAEIVRTLAVLRERGKIVLVEDVIKLA